MGGISIDEVSAYPLQWPVGWPRTKWPSRSKFKPPHWDRLCARIKGEVGLLGGRYTRISTNRPLRLDGLPKLNTSEPSDSGVAVWFVLDGVTKVLACDKWATVKENAHAICKSIDAMRGLKRWGAGVMLQRAMKGMEQDLLPAPPPWWSVLEVNERATADEIRSARLRLAKRYHPDSGTHPDALRMSDINRAVVEAAGALSLVGAG